MLIATHVWQSRKSSLQRSSARADEGTTCRTSPSCTLQYPKNAAIPEVLLHWQNSCCTFLRCSPSTCQLPCKTHKHTALPHCTALLCYPLCRTLQQLSLPLSSAHQSVSPSVGAAPVVALGLAFGRIEVQRHKGHCNDDHHASHEGGQDHGARLADLQGRSKAGKVAEEGFEVYSSKVIEEERSACVV